MKIRISQNVYKYWGISKISGSRVVKLKVDWARPNFQVNWAGPLRTDGFRLVCRLASRLGRTVFRQYSTQSILILSFFNKKNSTKFLSTRILIFSNGKDLITLKVINPQNRDKIILTVFTLQIILNLKKFLTLKKYLTLENVSTLTTFLTLKKLNPLKNFNSQKFFNPKKFY